jgi:hypothetical protein
MQDLLRETLPDVCVAWLSSQLDSFDVRCAMRPGSTRTGVWELESARGRTFFKAHFRRAKWATEVFVYNNWAHILHPTVPELLGTFQHESLHGLLLTAIDGVPLRETNVAKSDEERIYFCAGQLLRRINDHAMGHWFGTMDENGNPTDDASDVIAWLRSGLDSLMRRGAELACFNAEEMYCLRAAAELADSFSGEPFVPTGTDYTPGNWLIDEHGNLAGIIDFENMLWGPRTLPFTRLRMDYFPAHANLEDAFYAGYEGLPPYDHPEQTAALSAHYAGYYVIEGVTRKRPDFTAHGRAAFRRLR